jgi:hypothetical protein
MSLKVGDYVKYKGPIGDYLKNDIIYQIKKKYGINDFTYLIVDPSNPDKYIFVFNNEITPLVNNTYEKSANRRVFGKRRFGFGSYNFTKIVGVKTYDDYEFQFNINNKNRIITAYMNGTETLDFNGLKFKYNIREKWIEVDGAKIEVKEIGEWSFAPSAKEEIRTERNDQNNYIEEEEQFNYKFGDLFDVNDYRNFLRTGKTKLNTTMNYTIHSHENKVRVYEILLEAHLRQIMLELGN